MKDLRLAMMNKWLKVGILPQQLWDIIQPPSLLCVND